MNHLEFENEMHNFIHDSYEEFIGYQGVVNSILDEFHIICQNNDIQYFVAFGSLLGLVRDKGNIPWDYDIDVVVPIHQRAKLIQALENDLGKDFYYVYDNNLPRYPATCLRVCKKGYTYMAFHVDVFFLFGCPSDQKEQKKFFDKIYWTCYARQSHNVMYHVDTSGESRLKHYIKRAFAWIKYPITNKLLIKIENSIYEKYPLDKSEKCVIYYPLRKTYTTASFKKAKVINVDGHTLCIPENEDLFLTERYGDYKDYLPIQERFDEFYKMFTIVKERQRYFRESLQRLVDKL